MDWLKSLFRIPKTKEESGYDTLYQVVDVETNDKRYLNVERVLKYGVLRDLEPSVGEQQVRHVRVNVYSYAGIDMRIRTMLLSAGSRSTTSSRALRLVQGLRHTLRRLRKVQAMNGLWR